MTFVGGTKRKRDGGERANNSNSAPPKKGKRKRTIEIVPECENFEDCVPAAEEQEPEPEASEVELDELVLASDDDSELVENLSDGEGVFGSDTGETDQLSTTAEEFDDEDDNDDGDKELMEELGDASVESLRSRISNIVEVLGKKSSKSLVERCGKSRKQLVLELTNLCAKYYGYNMELCEYIMNLFSPAEAVEFFEANEQPRPMTLRVNTLKTRRRELAQTLIGRGANVDPVGDWCKVGLKVLESSVPLGATPEYLGGHYILQSASSFLPVLALAPKPGERVLDMAASPGGKSTHIAQLMKNQGVLFCNEMKKTRCSALIANLHRMGVLNSIVINFDGRDLPKHLKNLDRILLDAPCTGTGVVTRDPSVKLSRKPEDFKEMSILQKELLRTAVDMVDATSKTGGIIVYSTCSISVEEDESVVDYILKNRNVQLEPIGIDDIGVDGFTSFRDKRFHPSMKLTRRVFPHKNDMDGFFIAKLRKTSNEIPVKVKRDRGKVVEVKLEHPPPPRPSRQR